MDASARAFIRGIYAHAKSTEILCTGPYVNCLSAAYEDISDVNKSNCILGEASIVIMLYRGAQWLSGRVLDSRSRGGRFEPHRHHCVVVLEQDTFILATY